MSLVSDLIRRPPAEYEAARQYAQAVERHFDAAQEKVREGKVDEAEAIAKAAVELRDLARYELRP